MDQLRKYQENAENCVELAENAKDAPSRARYLRMAEGWLALVHEQEWLAGKVNRCKALRSIQKFRPKNNRVQRHPSKARSKTASVGRARNLSARKLGVSSAADPALRPATDYASRPFRPA